MNAQFKTKRTDAVDISFNGSILQIVDRQTGAASGITIPKGEAANVAEVLTTWKPEKVKEPEPEQEPEQAEETPKKATKKRATKKAD